VYVDLLCYRKYGHNEGDEPRFTQPLLYKAIEKHPNTRDIYAKQLIAEGVITQQAVDEMEKRHLDILEESLKISHEQQKTQITNFLNETWKDIRKATKADFLQSPQTGFPKEQLDAIATKLTSLPKELKFFRKTMRLQDQRHKLYFEDKKVDWALAELLAYGSLLVEGHPVRLSGQDVARGTFSHRHAMLRVEDSEQEYVPLNNLNSNQAKFDVYNSLLSEYGVLGFEYGYSLASPFTLTIWEAQFGDFNNGAQIIFDQFISSAEEKWNVMNDLVVLLPHGYEGQGPEHSSARIERFLTLCAENNIQVANCTTPANFFHILRRQLNRPFRKPLIIFTPKSLLRHHRCISDIDELVQGQFREVIDDEYVTVEKVKKVIFCSGKIYYDLLEEREAKYDDTVALVRLEQLYPLPKDQIKAIVAKYVNAQFHIWVQEEPLNMGAWRYIEHACTEIRLGLVARPESGSPATGSSKFHVIRHQKILDKAFNACDCPLVDEDCGMICIGNRCMSFEQELKDMKVDMIDSKFHSAERKLKANEE